MHRDWSEKPTNTKKQQGEAKILFFSSLAALLLFNIHQHKQTQFFPSLLWTEISRFIYLITLGSLASPKEEKGKKY
jgi:hypothetical protein